VARLIARLEEALDGQETGAPRSGPDAGAVAEDPSSFASDPAAASGALRSLDLERDRLVAFVGKLIVAKGVDLLLAGWPLVVEAVPDARLVVVGFGAYRQGCERLLAALGAGDLAAARRLAERGRAEEGGAAGRLDMLCAFLDSLEADPGGRERYLAVAARAAARVAFTGRLEHRELADLLPACEALAVPSTFPEAFGMVAAEAAACGALPVSARHSGLAEVGDALAGAVPEPARPWLAFDLGPSAVVDLAARLRGWLESPPPLRREIRAALVATARERWSWEGVAEGVIAAAQGRLDALPAPAPAARGLG
jgi:glycosyltransferase involved in cell wall biosynthesis